MLEGLLLKPNMVLPGKDCAHQVDAQEVATATLHCLRRTVPAAQNALAHRARCNSAAREGRYTSELEQGARELVGADRA